MRGTAGREGFPTPVGRKPPLLPAPLERMSPLTFGRKSLHLRKETPCRSEESRLVRSETEIPVPAGVRSDPSERAFQALREPHFVQHKKCDYCSSIILVMNELQTHFVQFQPELTTRNDTERHQPPTEAVSLHREVRESPTEAAQVPEFRSSPRMSVQVLRLPPQGRSTGFRPSPWIPSPGRSTGFRESPWIPSQGFTTGEADPNVFTDQRRPPPLRQDTPSGHSERTLRQNGKTHLHATIEKQKKTDCQTFKTDELCRKLTK